MLTESVTLNVYTHDRGDFNNLRDKRVLLYWPHGFGDWVQFSLVIPFLEPTNIYWMTRFGDDNVALMDRHPLVSPVYLGTNSTHCEDGGNIGVRHFGLEYERIHGEAMRLRVPIALRDTIVAEGISACLWTWYPETGGTSAPPYHTKARRMVGHLREHVPAEFARPLKRTLALETDAALRMMVEARLKNHCGFGERRLCLVGRGGFTSVGKNWGHRWRDDLPEEKRVEGQECQDFIELMLRRGSHWCFLLIEDRDFGDSIKRRCANTYAYADVFGEPETAMAPFALVMKCLVRLASLCVGVPAGPYHLAAQAESLPTVGVWLEHLPSWYDEPRDGLVHVIGATPAVQLTDDSRPGSFLGWEALRYKANVLDSRTIPGRAVMEAVETLLGASDWRPPQHQANFGP